MINTDYDSDSNIIKGIFSLINDIKKAISPGIHEKKSSTTEEITFLVRPMIVDQFDISISKRVMFVKYLTT